MAITHQSEHYWLELEEVNAGSLVSAEGGLAMSDVVEEKPGPGDVVRKHISGVKYSDIELGCAGGMMSGGFYDWIVDTLERRYARKNGAIVEFDPQYRVQSRLSFSNALLSQVRFPAADAVSKDAARLTVRLSPEYTRDELPSGYFVEKTAGQRPKRWQVANFRLSIDGLTTARVSRVEPVVVTTAIAEQAVGEMRDYQKQAAHLEISDLVVTLPEADAQSFRAWHHDFVIKGDSGPDKEKSGTLEFLTVDGRDILCRLRFSGLGIYKLAPIKPQGEATTTTRSRGITAWMYCEQIEFSAATAPPVDQSTNDPPGAPPTPPGVGEPLGMIPAGQQPGRFTRLRTPDFEA